MVLATTVHLWSQQVIGGVVNEYTVVRTITTIDCSAKVGVADASNFRSGDLVLLVQMKGSVVGATYNVDAVGLFEFATIDTIIGGNVLHMKRPLINTYNLAGIVQCVRVPVYGNVTVAFPLQGKPWDGTTGGVVAIDVRGTLTLQAPFDANGIGFRGGIRWNGGATCSTSVDYDRVNSMQAAAKGESIVNPLPTHVSGSAPLYSGGGGGCAHNSGGAGGGNGGVGGKGGSQWEGCGRFLDNGGRGGGFIQIRTAGKPRAVAGGGGGAGHMNDNQGTAGEAGGGIIVVRAATITGNGQRIRANGGTPPNPSGNDAAGGGGAGGTVVIECATLLGGVFIEANGGAGGDVRTSALHGPGGGGGGGSFIFSGVAPFAGMAFALNRGTGGQNVNRTNAAERAYLATGGQDGQSLFNTHIPEFRLDIPTVSVAAPRDTIVCPGTPVVLRARTTGTLQTLQWRKQSGAVIGSTPTITVTATNTDTFVVVVADSNGCADSARTIIGVSTGWIVDFPEVTRTAGLCADQIEDALWLFNLSPLPTTVARVTSSSSGVVVDFPAPVTVAPGEKVRIPVSVTLPVNGSVISSVIDASLVPCDTVVTTLITVSRAVRTFSVTPDTVVMPTVWSCTSVTSDSILSVRFGGSVSGCDVLDVIVIGPVDFLFTRQWHAFGNVPTMIPIRWRPVQSSSEARLGFVLREGACQDTVWITIVGRRTSPAIIASDTLNMPRVVLCAQSKADSTFVVQANDTTTWRIEEISVQGPVQVYAAAGDIIRGYQPIGVSVYPQGSGPYECTVSLRLSPCDTTVTIVVRGDAVDVAVVGTDSLLYTQRIIGRTETRTAVFTNLGTAPVEISRIELPNAPFSIAPPVPTTPMVLNPGAELRMDVLLNQRHGQHLDSIVVNVTRPCAARLTTILTAEAYARTTVTIPDVYASLGVADTVVVLLTERPQIDSALLTQYTMRVQWQAEVAGITSGLNAYAQWDVEENGDDVYINIVGTWTGGDTLAVLPIMPLLAQASTSDIVFSIPPGFEWTGQTGDVVHDNGVVILDDPCATRVLRSVTFGGVGALTLWPSPAADKVHVSVASIRNRSAQIRVFDVNGGLVLTDVASNSAHHTLDVRALPSGVYLVRVRIGATERSAVLSIRH